MLGKILSFKYWFNFHPTNLSPDGLQFLTIFLAVLLFLAIIFSLAKKRIRGLYHKIYRRLSSFFLTNFIIGIFLLFFAYEAVPFLSSRIWFLLWVLGMLVWLGFIIYALAQIPKLKEKLAKEQEYKKYLPGRK
jgi:glucan phosphoethanolaminetransferase (alkaline phosphatase superfamily)